MSDPVLPYTTLRLSLPQVKDLRRALREALSSVEYTLELDRNRAYSGAPEVRAEHHRRLAAWDSLLGMLEQENKP